MRMLWVAAVVVSLGIAAAAAADREEYYYPPITSEEVFGRTMLDVPPGTREDRVRFVINATKTLVKTTGSPRYVIFEKGSDAQHMIIVALDDQVFATIYRARAVLAQLTARIRGSEFFEKTGRTSEATWFDMAKLLGFEDVVISDGRTWSHRVALREP